MASMDVDDPETPWLDTVEGEIAFFRSLMRARPVGMHRHFHVLTMRNTILRDTGQRVELDDLWRKLRSCFDLENLESIVSEPPCVFRARGFNVHRASLCIIPTLYLRLCNSRFVG